MIYLTADELCDMIGGSDLMLVPEPPAELAPDGALVVWPSIVPIPAGFDAYVIEGVQSEALFVGVTRELFDLLEAM